MLARGASLSSAEPELEILVSLAGDPDGEVNRLARESMARLSDKDLARLLQTPLLAESVARYFLDPAHMRKAVLPVLLANPTSPQDAVTALAAEAGPEILAVLLEHLDLLKTPALAALKGNPYSPEAAAPALQMVLPTSPEQKLAAARGQLEIPEEHRLAVLVLLSADSSQEIGRAAHETLQQMPEEQCMELVTAPSLPEVVARYFLDPAYVRPSVLPLLLIHPDSPQDAITKLAAQAGPEALAVLLEQLDLLKTPALIALKDNPAYLDWQTTPPKEGFVLEVNLLEMLIQEVESEGLQPVAEELEEDAEPEKSEGTFSKIAKMSVAKKVVLALRGNKEERAILVRDGSKVVSRAVLGSPKLTEAEVESFAAQKNVSQDVLRLIAMSRKFIKDYIVVKNLANNPRLPIDLGLALVGRLMPNDVRALAANRDVSDTVRKMAHRLISTRTH